MVYSVIMAGGIGSRFWPRSREVLPKQFLNVLGDATLLQNTCARMQSVVPMECTYIVTHKRYADLTRNQLPELQPHQVLAEPISRNTAPCIAYAAARLRALDDDAVMIAVPADHLVRDEKALRRVLEVAIDAARASNVLVTIGIKPTHPETGYGYIQFEDDQGSAGSELRAYPVRTFAEKPNIATAERFLDSGDFVWNSGIFVWRVDTILEQFKRHLPVIYEAFDSIADVLGTSREPDAVAEAYHKCPRISIDYGVMERSAGVMVVPGSFGWSDIGDWRAVYDLSDKDRHGNVLKGPAVVQGTSRCYVHADSRLVVCVGMHDVVVVDTEDALLVCHRESSQEVRHVVDWMRAHRWEDYV